MTATMPPLIYRVVPELNWQMDKRLISVDDQAWIAPVSPHHRRASAHTHDHNLQRHARSLATSAQSAIPRSPLSAA